MKYNHLALSAGFLCASMLASPLSVILQIGAFSIGAILFLTGILNIDFKLW